MKKLLALSILSLGFSSCGSVEGFSATFNVPLPEQFGGGSIPITIEK
jgi:hypothetical protein